MQKSPFLALILLPIFAFAEESGNGFYGIFETGFEYLNLQTADKQTKINKNNLHTFRAKGGYEWDTGWRFGLNLGYTGGGSQFDMSGVPFERGASNMPYRAEGGANAIILASGLQGSYHAIRSQEQDLYINVVYTVILDGIAGTFPLYSMYVGDEIRLELEGRNLVLPKWSIGYMLGASFGRNDSWFYSADEDYMRLMPIEKKEHDTLKDDEAWAKVGGVWGLHGDVKWIYHMTPSKSFFIKWDFQVKFYPKSEEVHVRATHVPANRSLGEMSLYTPKTRVFRSGIAIGAAF